MMNYDEIIATLRHAVKLAEAGIAELRDSVPKLVVPVINDVTRDDNSCYVSCTCGEIVGKLIAQGSRYADQQWMESYCSECGAKMDWERLGDVFNA